MAEGPTAPGSPHRGRPGPRGLSSRIGRPVGAAVARRFGRGAAGTGRSDAAAGPRPGRSGRSRPGPGPPGGQPVRDRDPPGACLAGGSDPGGPRAAGGPAGGPRPGRLPVRGRALRLPVERRAASVRHGPGRRDLAVRRAPPGGSPGGLRTGAGGDRLPVLHPIDGRAHDRAAAGWRAGPPEGPGPWRDRGRDRVAATGGLGAGSNRSSAAFKHRALVEAELETAVVASDVLRVSVAGLFRGFPGGQGLSWEGRTVYDPPRLVVGLALRLGVLVRDRRQP